MTPILAPLIQYANHCSKNNSNKCYVNREENNYSTWACLLNPIHISDCCLDIYLLGCLTCLKWSCWTSPPYLIFLFYPSKGTATLFFQSLRAKAWVILHPFSHTSHPSLQQILSLYMTSLKYIWNLTNSQHYYYHSSISQCYDHFPGKQPLPKRSFCVFPSPSLSY